MTMGGAFQNIADMVALFGYGFFAAVRDYVIKFDVTTWGWFQLPVGVVLVTAALAVSPGPTWSRVVGRILAALNSPANFSFIPSLPIWSPLIVALDVFVI